LTRYANAEVYIPPDPPNFNEADVSDMPKWVRKLAPLSQSTIDAWRKERVASQLDLLGVDDGIQKVVDALKAKGQLDNTLIVFMGDHGFSWGSHRWIKKECVYEECGKMPFVVRYPGLVVNREENRLISNVDLVPTITDYTGVTPELPQDGTSFLPLLNDTATNWKEEVFITDHGASSTSDRTFDGIRVPGWTYAEYANGDKELYDLVADPYQLQNQANMPAYQAKQNELPSVCAYYAGSSCRSAISAFAKPPIHPSAQ
jgi:N-acetylglucosamine-6-sulfatase